MNQLPINERGGIDVPPFTMIPDNFVFPPRSTIGHKCHVGAGVRFGDYCIISDDVVVGPHARFGNFCTLHNRIVVGKRPHFGRAVMVGDNCTFGDGVHFGSACTFGQKARFLGYARFGDMTHFALLAQFMRPAIVGTNSTFEGGRPDLVIDPHRDIVRLEKAYPAS